jgi:hypothetical protein
MASISTQVKRTRLEVPFRGSICSTSVGNSSVTAVWITVERISPSDQVCLRASEKELQDFAWERLGLLCSSLPIDRPNCQLVRVWFLIVDMVDFQMSSHNLDATLAERPRARRKSSESQGVACLDGPQGPGV